MTLESKLRALLAEWRSSGGSSCFLCRQMPQFAVAGTGITANVETRIVFCSEHDAKHKDADELEALLAERQEPPGLTDAEICRPMAIRTAIAKELAEPYPESIFTPLTDAELERCVDSLSKSGVKAASDRLHASWARHWAKWLAPPALAGEAKGTAVAAPSSGTGERK